MSTADFGFCVNALQSSAFTLSTEFTQVNRPILNLDEQKVQMKRNSISLASIQLNSAQRFLPRWRRILGQTRVLTKVVFLSVLLAAMQCSATGTRAEDAAANSSVRLQQAVFKMSVWMGGSEHADQWRKQLHLNLLETQAALGPQADVSTLMLIHERFANESDLDHPAVTEVRDALAGHILQLQAAQNVDPLNAIASARYEYRTIGMAELESQRNRLLYDLRVLEKFYRESLPSRERANVYFDLQLDQLVQFVDSIEFELPPEFSVGKTDSMIKTVKEQLEEVVKKIDAMPIEDEVEEGDQEQGAELPGPDSNQATRDELEQQKNRLQSQLDALLKQRKQYLKQDSPRRKRRQQTFAELRRFEQQFAKQKKTLGDPFFVSAASNLERFNRTFFYGTDDNLQEDFLVKLTDLEKSLNELYAGTDVRRSAGEIGDTLRWLENANQGEKIVTSIRSRFSLPNLYLSASSQMLNQLANQPVNECQEINQSSNGGLLRGKALLTGNVSVELQDDPQQVNASIRLMGDIASDLRLQRGKLEIYSGATGQFEARRSVYANVGGMYANDPYGATNIAAYFLGTSSRLDLVNRIAAKKFAEVQAKSEGDSARDAELELNQQFLDQTDEAIASGKKSLNSAVESGLENSQYLPNLYLRSTFDRIVAVGKKATIATLGAQTPPSDLGLTDLNVRLHETFLSNYLDDTFSNKTFTDKQLAEMFAEMGADTSAFEAGGDQGQDQSFSITFAQVRPVQFEFEQNRFSVVVSGRRFAQGNRRINEGLKIIIRFKIRQQGQTLQLVRDGKAEIAYLDLEKKSPRTVAFKSFLEGRLNPKDQTEETAVELPDNLIPKDDVDALKDVEIIDRLELAQVKSENGWLYLGWNYVAEGTTGRGRFDVPAIWNESVISGMDPTYLESPQSAPLVVPGQAVEIIE